MASDVLGPPWLDTVSSAERSAVAAQARGRGVGGEPDELPYRVGRLAEKWHERQGGLVPLPQRTLAAMLGAQRPSLNKILKELEREGLIGVRYAAIDILNPEGLSKRAG